MGKKKVLAFAGSNSVHSINKKLVTSASNMMDDFEVEMIDINDYEMPIFGVDKEKVYGIPKLAHDMKALIKSADGIMISLAEHNGAYSAAFKNLFDWISRTQGGAFEGKLMLLLATSPGKRGGMSVLEIASTRFPFNGGVIVGTFSLPSFNDNFDLESGLITNPEKLEELKARISDFQKALLA